METLLCYVNLQLVVDTFLNKIAWPPYGLADEAAIHGVCGLRSIAHGFVTLELAGGFGLALDRDESFRRLLHAYVAGLRTQGTP
jgi:hypothetical protein